MPVRISGMNSGLDTEALVKELVSAYSKKKDTYTKKQTKLEWTMDAWKDVNTKVYGFYTKSLSNMRYSTNYNLRTTSISKPSVAQVSASAGAVTSTQSLAVKQLAASAYFTGGEIKTQTGERAKGNSKLSELGITDGSIMINDTKIALDGDMTVNQLVASFKNAGVTASYDENTGRFFVNANSSGSKGEFSITAGSAFGVDALSKLGLLSFNDVNGEETAELKRYREMAADGYDAATEVDERYEKARWTVDKYKSSLEGKVNSAKKSIESLETSNEKLQKQLDELNADDYDWKEKYDSVEDFTKAKEDIQKKLDENNAKITEHQQVINDNQPYLTSETALSAEVDRLNADIRSGIQADVDAEVAAAVDIVDKYDAGLLSNSADSARINAKDAIIKLNGATFTSNTNTFSINGLNINAMETTVTTSVDENGNVVEHDNAITINTTIDTKGIYDKIKKMFSEYNELVSYMDGLYYAESAKGYEPLTDEEKQEMTDKQIEDWEEKIKESLLRRDSTLGGLSSAMKSAIVGSSMTINGKEYSLATFGIGTGSYFSTSNTDRGKFHIDGDEDDPISATNQDKLMAAISEDPDAVIQFFQKLSSNLYDTLGKKMASSAVSSAFTIYNDKQMSSQYSDLSSKVNDWEERLKKYEDSYYKKFSAMETALAKLQSQQTSLSSMLGG